MQYGSFPYAATMSDPSAKIDDYLEGIYNTVIVRDIEERQNRKAATDKRKITDIALLKKAKMGVRA